MHIVIKSAKSFWLSTVIVTLQRLWVVHLWVVLLPFTGNHLSSIENHQGVLGKVLLHSLCAVGYFQESSATGLAFEVFEGSIPYGCYSLCVVTLFL